MDENIVQIYSADAKYSTDAKLCLDSTSEGEEQQVPKKKKKSKKKDPKTKSARWSILNVAFQKFPPVSIFH